MLLKNYFAKAQGYTNSRAVTNQLVDLEQKCKSEEELIKHGKQELRRKLLDKLINCSAFYDSIFM